RLFGLPDPALVEKDWLVVKSLTAIGAAEKGPFQLVFQGGTALSRAHRVIERMSEDIDIKIVSEGPPPRPALRRLRESITAELHKAGFEFDPKNPQHMKSNYESRYTLYRLPYEPVAAGQGALRPEIQIETSVWPVRRPPVARPVISYIAEAFKRPPEVPAIDCAAIVETAAEKFVALTRRAGAELAGIQRERDPTLVRHIYDLHVIREHYDPAEVAALAREIMQADAAAYGGQFPAYRDNPLVETLRAAAGIASDPNYAVSYASFRRTMVYGAKPEFTTAAAAVTTIAEHLAKQN
ncbi:MAG TPA: nucleotidyl transferase AbiEii/AbiGii toxin family protein, partial [Beijerinckiaceae bacterium]|nr:nucleotidyl transferase AbiEii/AbiGii toxin family protein [Beijerinckiaceae bacterium]